MLRVPASESIEVTTPLLPGAESGLELLADTDLPEAFPEDFEEPSSAKHQPKQSKTAATAIRALLITPP